MVQRYSGLNDRSETILVDNEDEDENENGGGNEYEDEGPETFGPSPEAGMDDEEFASVVGSAIDDAADYIDGYVAPARAQATEYYRGDPLGNEEEGRSTIVMTEVRDTVQAIIPSLLRIFTASEQVVEYAPRTEATVEQAAQATDYVNFVFYNDNPGFSILHQTFKDALVNKTGIIKWRWSEDTEISEAEYTGLDEASLNMLLQDPTVELVEAEQTVVQEAQIGPDGMMISPQIVTYEVTIKRNIPKNKIVIETLPPEEFLIARDARDIETASYVGHRSLKTVSELVAMGYDREEIEEYAGEGDVFSLNYEAQVRNPAVSSLTTESDNPDPTMRRVMYVESYIRIDKDGDGIAELRKVCSIGGGYHVLHEEIVPDAPFAFFCPDPEPHMVIGQSIADQTMDLQRIKSAIVRNTMDSLAQVIHPRTVVVEGQVNMDDVMNNETGAIIRARAPGMVQALAEPFVGQNAMPIIAYMDEVRAQRTGISAASQGLNPDVLQSTTKAAVTATVQGAQERIELIARLFAENGMKRLFKGLLRMLIMHQDKPRMVRLRGKWVEVDPRYWDADMDVQVNVALGHGTDTDKLQFLTMVSQKQEQIMQMLGPDNPLVDVSQYRNTLAQICTLAGFKDAARYFKPVDMAQVQQMQAAASQNQPPDPAQQMVQIEATKAQAQQQIEMLKTQNDREEMVLKAQLEREKMQIDMMLRLAEIEAKYGTQIDAARIKAQIDAEVKKDANRLNAAQKAQSMAIQPIGAGNA